MLNVSHGNHCPKPILSQIFMVDSMKQCIKYEQRQRSNSNETVFLIITQRANTANCGSEQTLGSAINAMIVTLCFNLSSWVQINTEQINVADRTQHSL